ncbi:hypothetical protein [Rhizobium sp. BK060]|uniref:hypothetical protein n=1 Tax=Rhizobium sp. BK060 TaxID=2587096 RepID=UPI00161C3FE0|nr:hypothetical protein [Rhizobium sp. BK060]MBB3399710.1 hypothetical protein [Rhizobium sp. BK060]
MRIANRTALLLLTGLSLCTATAVTAGQQERNYFHSGEWEVVMTTPDETASARPYCETRSTAWAARRIAFRTSLEGVDELRLSVHIYKAGWNLPANQATTVSLGRAMFPFQAQVPMTVTTPETLSGDSWDKAAGLLLALIIPGITNAEQPLSLQVTFEGNEEPWIVPAMTQYDAYMAGQASKECSDALVAMAPTIFGLPSDDQASATSPFAKGSGTSSSQPVAPGIGFNAGVGTAAPPTAVPGQGQAASTASQPVTGWRFSTAEEDWGKTCYAETQSGNVKVGFMASPGKDLVGFVEGVFEGETRATWRVDDGAPHVSDGNQEDYFGWHGFYQLPEQLLTEVAGGKQLAITDLTGKRTVVDLQGAKQATSSFNQCRAS